MTFGGDDNAAMRARIAAHDWTGRGLGDPATWPKSLHVLLAIALDTAFPMLIMWGPQLVQLYNGGYVRIFGDKHPRSLGQPAAECWADIWSDVGPLLEGVYARGEAVYFENMPLKMERGGHYEDAFFTFSYSPIRDGDDVVGVVCIVNETTAHVLRERETAERAQALAELDRAKTQFFNNVSHEFRTPLTLMLGPLEELVRTLPEYEARQQADLARRNAVRLRKLVNSLLDFSRAQSGLEAAVRTSVELDAVTAELVSEFRSAFERAGVTLRFVPGVGAAVPLDRAMYEKIVLNLLSNALKFTLSGTVDVRTLRDGDEVRVQVSDTGVGIPADAIPRLFDRFSRVGGTSARSHEGTGIGLALVNEMVALLGGRIDVESRAGHGSTFTVRLPANAPLAAGAEPDTDTSALRQGYREEADALVPAARGATSAPAAPAGAPRIMIADDNADLREYLARLLGARYQVTLVANGADVLQRAITFAPDVIVLDVMMPWLDGFEVLRRLREAPHTALVPVILLSARAGDEASAEALSRGADDYIIKPFVASDLVARIDALLRRSAHFDARVSTDRLESELLAGIADRFISASDTRAVWSAISAVLTPVFTDWCVVYVPEDDGRIRACSVAHAEPAKVELGEMMSREYPTRRDDGSSVARVFATGEPLFVPRVNADFIASGQRDERQGAVIRALNIRSAIVVPVIAGGAVVAAISAVRAENTAPFDAGDLRFLERCARGAALAFENARAHERERTIAATLQRALLPAVLPVVDGLRFSAAYSPAASEGLVGGDWYDALALSDGRVFISIGDVVGHGLAAATVMGTLRQAGRGFALEGADPGEILAGLNRLLLAERDGRLATAYVAIIDPRTLEIAVATAGHPGAIRVTGEDTAETLHAHGLILGADGGARYTTTVRVLEPGDLIAFYTDGFVENERDIFAGERRLAAALRQAYGTADPAPLVHRELFGALPPHDDAALLVVVAEPHLASLKMTLVATPRAAARARAALRRFLDGTPMSEDRRFELLIAAGEAVINAIEHGNRDEVHGSIRLGATRTPTDVVIDVEDDGRWRPGAATAQRGYGLPLMHAFADAVEIERRRDGTRVRIAAACEPPGVAVGVG